MVLVIILSNTLAMGSNLVYPILLDDQRNKIFSMCKIECGKKVTRMEGEVTIPNSEGSFDKLIIHAPMRCNVSFYYELSWMAQRF